MMMNKGKILGIVGGIIISVVAFSAIAHTCSNAIKQIPFYDEDGKFGEPPFYNWTVQDLNGKKLNLSTLDGKVVFLNIWASWCGPCRREMPSIQRLYNAMRDKKVIFVCVSNEPLKNVKEFINDFEITIEEKKQPFTVPVYVMKTESPSAFRYNAYPTTFIVSKGGEIDKYVGTKSWNDEEYKEMLTKLVQKK